MMRLVTGLLIVVFFATSPGTSNLRAGDTGLSVEVKLVEVYASVRNHKGKPVPGLKEDNFEVREEDHPQSIRFFESESSGLTVALLIDSTGSIAKELPIIKKAGATLLSGIKVEDTFGLFTFTNRLNVLYPFRHNSQAALDAFMKINAGGRTALYDCLAQMIRGMKDIRGRKAILVLTDGDDNASLLPKAVALTAVRKAGVPLYTLAVGRACEDKVLFKRLEQLAQNTGGLCLPVKSSNEMVKVFSQVVEDLRSLYLMGYYANGDRDGRYRSISVLLPRQSGLKVRAKKGYWP